MKKIFLIDTENVGRNGYNPLDSQAAEMITSDDVFLIGHNRIHGHISPKIIDAIASSKASYRIVEIYSNSKNAMDFSLASEMGYLISTEGNKAKYYIVSQDRGYEALIPFAKAHGCELRIIPSVSKLAEEKKSQEEEMQIFQRLLPELTKKALNIAFRCYCNSVDSKTYHNKLQVKLIRDYHMVYERTAYLLKENK